MLPFIKKGGDMDLYFEKKPTDNILKKFKLRVSFITFLIISIAVVYVYYSKRELFYENFTTQLSEKLETAIKDKNNINEIYKILTEDKNIIYLKIIFPSSKKRYIYINNKITNEHIKNIRYYSKLNIKDSNYL